MTAPGKIFVNAAILLVLLGGLPNPCVLGENLEIPPDILYSNYAWQAQTRFLTGLPEQRPQDIPGWEKEQMKKVLDDRQQTAENRYLAASSYADYVYVDGMVDEVSWICDNFPPKADDFGYQAECMVVQTKDVNEQISRFQQIAEKARQVYPRKMLASHVYKMAASVLNNAGRVHEAIHMYKKSFETIPETAGEELAKAKISLAFAYSSSMFSTSMRQQALRYFDEVREWYRDHDPSPEKLDFKWVSYNKGLGHLLLFGDYAQAIEELKLVAGNNRLATDALVFMAYSHAQLGQTIQAKEVLATVDLTQSRSPSRRAFLQCYMDLTRLLLKESRTIESCLSLENPQTDVLLDLTKTLSAMNLPPADENRMWRKFYGFFSKHLLPGIRDTLESATAQADLENERARGRLKDLQLQNFSLYKYLTAAMVITILVVGAALFMALRQRRRSHLHAKAMADERERLQNILDSIEEGILIISEGLKIKVEDSKHFRTITGNEELRSLSLSSLLDLFRLGEDQKSLIVSCLEASLGEEPLAWELNSSHLPASTQIEEREIACFWQPVFANQRLRSVLLVLRDVSATRALERESEKAKVKVDRIMICAREVLSGHPQAAARFLDGLPEQLQTLIDRLEASGNDPQLLRVVHTIKGSARTLGLRQLQDLSHHVESQIRAGSDTLPLELKELKMVAETYRSALTDIIGTNTVAAPTNLYDIVAGLKTDLQQHLEEAGITLERLIVSDTARLELHEVRSLQDILLHALTNAADHGFILPCRRGWKAHPASFEITLNQQGSSKVLHIRDNGKGIDYAAIRAVAEAQSWQPKAGQGWADFLFLEGVSTASEVSQRSGRGVGLSVIAQATQSIKGEVHVLDNDQGKGTMLRIHWPATRSLKESA